MTLFLRRHLALQPEDALIDFDVDAESLETAFVLLSSQFRDEFLRDLLSFLAIRFRLFADRRGELCGWWRALFGNNRIFCDRRLCLLHTPIRPALL